MKDIPYFDRLVASAERIARHASYPGKDEAVRLCVEDIEGLVVTGQITGEQRDVLRGILLGACPIAA